ncbi:hypothetical protein FQN50_008052 [Emmonsiellopsis sp. PD_5]|nr:hypothetical protein FQN50_008052 [Emmonsiellopsis sp. PD_5]
MTSEPQSRPDFALAQKLHNAAEAGDLDTVNQALNEGADINDKRGKRQPALFAAVIHNHMDVVRLLLERGANANNATLIRAAEDGNLPLVQLFLDSGADLFATSAQRAYAFHAACVGGNLSVVQLLLDSGADPYARCEGPFVTALQAAAISPKEGSTAVVRFLLDIGCDVNEQGGKIGSALQAAIYSANLPVVKLLLDRGANVNAQCGKVENALKLAATKGRLSFCPLIGSRRRTEDTFFAIVQLLLDRGADVNAQDGSRYGNALHTAVAYDFTRAACLLLEKGASACFPTRSPGDSSILQLAVEHRNHDLLKTLLEKGCNDHSKNSSGWTPLHYAVILKDLISLELLHPYIDKSALNNIDIDGNTPLHSAVDRSAADIVDWLVRKGANTALLDSDAMTPFQQAAKKNCFPALFSLFANTPKEFRDVKASKWRASSLASKEYDSNIVITDAIKILARDELVAYLKCPNFKYKFTSFAQSTWVNTDVWDSIFADGLGWKITMIVLDGAFDAESACGVHWSWWRKYFKVIRGYGIRSNKIPTPVAVSQLSAEQGELPHHSNLFQAHAYIGFLDCRIIMPTCIPIIFKTPQPVSFDIRETNHAIGWIMVKRCPSPQELKAQSDLETRFIFSTLEYVNIPSSPTDLFMPLVQQLSDEWSDVCEAAVKHLSRMRSETFQCNGSNPNLIKVHLKDAQQWSRLGELLDEQISVLRSLAETYGEKRPAVLAKESVLWAKKEIVEFDKAITELRDTKQDKFKHLASTSQELIQLVNDGSLKRLSWITSIFGMNVNVLANNPAWWLYIPFALGTVVLSLTVWVLFKRNPKLEDTIEKKLEFLFKSRSNRNRSPDEEQGDVENAKAKEVKSQ